MYGHRTGYQWNAYDPPTYPCPQPGLTMRSATMRTLWKTTIVLLSVALLIVSCGGSGGGGGSSDEGGGSAAAQDCTDKTIRLSFIASDTSTWAKASEEFKERTESETDGRITVELYSGGQLASGNQQAELQQVQQGVIDALWVSPIILALYADPRFDIYSLPFLFPDHEVANEVIDGEVGELTEGWLREAGFEPLGWGVNGFRQVTNDERPIRTPADMEGLKFRVAGTDLFKTVFSELGAEPVTMSFGEVFTALQQGAIDGQENPLSIIYSSSLQDVQSHVSLWNYSYDPLVLAMNQGAFDGLCAEDQEVLKTAAQAGGDLQRELTIEEDESLPAQLEAEGMEVVPTEDIDVEAFRDLIVEPIYTQWEEIIGADNLQMMVDAVEQAEGS
ncbi:MAG: DctP family TRAP transporter solute-binding subunit [Geodermatophilaceae bacterium]